MVLHAVADKLRGAGPATCCRCSRYKELIRYISFDDYTQLMYDNLTVVYADACIKAFSK